MAMAAAYGQVLSTRLRSCGKQHKHVDTSHFAGVDSGSSPWLSSLFAMPLQPMEEWVVFLIMGSVSIALP